MNDSTAALGRIIVVLWETQDLVNIAGTIRAMKNFGLGRLRLVSPVEWDPWRIEGIAHDTEDIVQAVETTGQRFRLGVQWHPELMAWSPRQLRLFRALVAAAAEEPPERRSRQERQRQSPAPASISA